MCSLPAEAAARWVAFDADRIAYNRDIYLVRADGSQLVRLTSDPTTEKDAAFSNDASSLAFASDRSGTMQIYVMDLATRATKALTSLPDGADEPSWSKDDREIVFHTGASVFLMNADGTNAHVIGTGLDNFNAYKYPALSADGTQVIFDRNNEIDALNVDGGGQRYVVQNWTTTEETPALSPDGVNAAFAVSCAPAEQIAVTPFAGYLADPCKGEFVTPASAGSARRPAWGPAGVIAFEHALSNGARDGGVATFGTAAIGLSTAPGSTPCDLVTGPGDSRNPNWAPAGFQPH